MSYLLDTNVLSEARRERGDARVKDWLRRSRREEMFISSLAVGEIRQGIDRLKRRDPVQAQPIEAWFRKLRVEFAERVLPITADVAEEWGRLNVPDPPPPIDGLMAATARVHGLIFVTRDVDDIRRTGVALFNPWTDS